MDDLRAWGREVGADYWELLARQQIIYRQIATTPRWRVRRRTVLMRAYIDANAKVVRLLGLH